MAKFDSYPEALSLLPDDLMITDGTRGTKVVKTGDLIYKALDSIPQMHKTIWRGKNLGSRYTTEQQTAVANGTLSGIWLGDYWENSGVRWTIVDFESSNTAMQDLPNTYLTVMPDRSLGTAEMLTSDTNVAMQDTNIYRYLDTWYLGKFETVFGSTHILEHPVSFEGSWTDGSWEGMRIGGPTDVKRINRKTALLTEIEWFSSRIVTTLANEQWALQTSSLKQFAAFRYGWTPILPSDVGVWLHARATRRYYGAVKKGEGAIMNLYSVKNGVIPYVLVR